MMLTKPFYLAIGFLGLFLGVIGLFLPLIPTTPFLIIAAFGFSRGSKRLHRWLLSIPLFGKLLMEWERYHSIPIYAKWLATVFMGASFAWMLFAVPVGLVLKAVAVAVGAAVLVFVWTRPSQGSREVGPDSPRLNPHETRKVD